MLDADGGRLEVEGGLRSCWGARRGVLGVRALHFAVLRCGIDVLRRWRGWSIGRFGGAREPWGVGGGLHAKLGEVQIRSGLVAAVHSLRESSFGVEAVKDHGVDEEDRDLDDYFDDRTYQAPVLGQR